MLLHIPARRALGARCRDTTVGNGSRKGHRDTGESKKLPVQHGTCAHIRNPTCRHSQVRICGLESPPGGCMRTGGQVALTGGPLAPPASSALGPQPQISPLQLSSSSSSKTHSPEIPQYKPQGRGTSTFHPASPSSP